MILPDVNILVHAHKEQAPDHERFRQWMENLINGEAAYGMSELVVSGFIRIVTHPRIFDPPSTLDIALQFASDVLAPDTCVRIAAGPRHFQIFERLTRSSGAKGNLIPDAYLAALAIESGCEWVTTDRDFGRFAGLGWRHPFTA